MFFQDFFRKSKEWYGLWITKIWFQIMNGNVHQFFGAKLSKIRWILDSEKNRQKEFIAITYGRPENEIQLWNFVENSQEGCFSIYMKFQFFFFFIYQYYFWFSYFHYITWMKFFFHLLCFQIIIFVCIKNALYSTVSLYFL